MRKLKLYAIQVNATIFKLTAVSLSEAAKELLSYGLYQKENIKAVYSYEYNKHKYLNGFNLD